MYKRLHQAPISTIADTLIIQDVYISDDKAEEFLISLRSKFGLEKIWMCPIKGTTSPQVMSPHYHKDQKPPSDHGLINFGIWLHKPAWQPGSMFARQATRDVEVKVASLGGRKMLYSLSRYSPEQWRAIYDVDAYQELKDRWDSDNAFGDIYQKVGLSPAIKAR